MSNNLPAQPTKKSMLSDAQYNQLKFLAQVVLPALGALYFGLAAIWGLPEADKVVGTITTVDVFLGIFLIRETKKYNESDAQYDGFMHVMETDSSLVHQLEIKTDPEQLAKQTAIKLKVVPKHSSGYGDSVFPEDRL